MRISRRKLNRARNIIYSYILLSIIFSIVVVYRDKYNILYSILIILLTLSVVFIYGFLIKFLKRYQNFQDKYHIITWIIALIILHNSYFVMQFNPNFGGQSIQFISKLGFIFIVFLLNAFYIVLYSNVFRLSRKHFLLLRPLSISFFIIPIIYIVSFGLMYFSGNNLIDSLSKNTPSIILALVQLPPFFILGRILRQAKYVKD